MPAFSSNAFSTNAFSVNAFSLDAGGGAAAPQGTAAWLAPPIEHKERKRRSRILYGLEEEIVHEVAARQVAALDLDEHQRREELLAELRLHRIEARATHFEELARIRNALIDHEIASHMKRVIQKDEDVAAVMIIMGAVL